MKTITKEKGLLETKRIDLDACKNRVRKARSMLGTQSVSSLFLYYTHLFIYFFKTNTIWPNNFFNQKKYKIN